MQQKLFPILFLCSLMGLGCAQYIAAGGATSMVTVPGSTEKVAEASVVIIKKEPFWWLPPISFFMTDTIYVCKLTNNKLNACTETPAP